MRVVRLVEWGAGYQCMSGGWQSWTCCKWCGRIWRRRYKGSMLGNLWPLLNQVSQLLIYYVFSIVLKVKLSLKGLPANDLTLVWLFAGLLPWTAFMTGFWLQRGLLISQPNLVKKVVHSVVTVGACLFWFGLMVMILLVGITTQTVHVRCGCCRWSGAAVTANCRLRLYSSWLHGVLRDVPQTLAVLVNLWFMWRQLFIRQRWFQKHGVLIFWLNPMTAIVEVYQY